MSSLPDDTSSQTIFIKPGTYRGQVILKRRGPTTLQGYTEDIKNQGANKVLLTNSLVASVAGSNSKSATLQVYADDTKIYNINIENSYGTGGGRGAQAQALALSQSGLRNGYYGVGFLSYQACIIHFSFLPTYRLIRLPRTLSTPQAEPRSSVAPTSREQ